MPTQGLKKSCMYRSIPTYNCADTICLLSSQIQLSLQRGHGLVDTGTGLECRTPGSFSRLQHCPAVLLWTSPSPPTLCLSCLLTLRAPQKRGLLCAHACVYLSLHRVCRSGALMWPGDPRSTMRHVVIIRHRIIYR